MVDYEEHIYLKKQSNSLPTYILSLGINMFFFLILFIPSMTKYWAILLFGFDLLYIFLIKDNLSRNFYFNINSITKSWFSFILVSFIGLTMTDANLGSGIQFIFTLGLFILNYILLISNEKWTEISIKMLLITTLFFLFGTILQLISPDLILWINSLHLSDVLFEQSLEFHGNELLNGFTYQTGMNGFILSILMGINFAYIFKVNKKTQKIVLLATYFGLFYLLFLTGKRGFILFSVLILFFFILRMSKKKGQAILILLFITILMSVMVLTTEAGMDLVQRSLSQEDFSTGRGEMIGVMWNDFLDKPILGHGTYTTIDVVDYTHGHNIYFQVLRENGLIGFISLLSALLISLVKTNIKIEKFYSNKKIRFILIISLYLQLLFVLWGLTGNPLYDTFPLYIYIVAVALSETYSQENYNIYNF